MTPKKRYFVYAGMFAMMAISYVDRINLAVAAPAIAKAYDLSPVQMGYVFSSYLWTYLIFLVPMGMAVDRWGARRIGAGSLFVWSIGGAATGLIGGLGSLLGARMLLGVGEAAGYPVGGRVIREWAPVAERGRAASWLNGGAYAGLAIGAVVVGWLVSGLGWRESFLITGGVGLLAALAWWALYRTPEQARWLSREERELLGKEPAARQDVAPVSATSSLAMLLRSRTMWGLALTQGCAGYTLYLFMSWLPTYLATSRNLDVVSSGLFTAVPYAAAVVLGLMLGKVSDSYLRNAEVGLDARRRMVAACLVLSSVILLTPLVTATWLLLTLFSISLTCVSTAMGMCIALTNDLLHDGRGAGVAVSFLIFGGNSFGVLAPIVTGYVVAATGTFSAAFLLAGVLLLVGSVTVLTLTRRPIDAAVLDPAEPTAVAA
jgi:MFS family permease